MIRHVPVPVRSLTVALALLARVFSPAQELIPNGSFELGTLQCGLYGQFTFNTNVTDWSSPTIGSPDIFHTSLPDPCANSALGSSDITSWGQEQPYAGDAMLAVISYCSGCIDETREYAQAALAQPMIPGTSYHARMFISRADRCRFGTNDLGMYFSVDPPSGSGWPSLPYAPQVKAANIVETTEGWVLIAGDFVADAAFAYVTIGNFSTDAQVGLADLDADGLGYAVYFIDAVSLTRTGQGPYITGAALICAGDEIELTANNTSDPQWSTVADPDLILSTDQVLTVSPAEPTTYLLTQGNATATFTVHVVPPPEVDLGNDTTLCSGAEVVLEAGPPGARYRWQDGSTANAFTVTEAGSYWVTVTAGTCMAADTIEVTYDPGPAIELGNDTTLCPGASLLLDASAAGADQSWQDGSTNSTLLVTMPGLYWVVVTGPRCATSDSIRVAYDEIPITGLLEDQALCNDDELRYWLSVSGGTWVWQDGSTASPHTISEAGSYTVITTTALCTTSVTFNVTLIECEPFIVLPNVISPNGDGYNDVFVPITYRGIVHAELRILNRWGNELHRSTDLARGWRAHEVPEGTYYWMVDYTDAMGRRGGQSGHVTILR